ncbi:MAG TPA: asparagine synthase-related protein, partial [Phenylobacterium sp.]
ALPELLDACVRALTTDAQAILAEISGGLDSAIVASSLAPVAGGKVRQWLNFHAAGGSGDELVFAREVAALQGFALTETLKSPLVFSAERVEAGARGLRPGFNALDSARDRDVAQLTEQLGVDRIVTGQGGDMVFFNTPTPLVAADFLRRAGPRGLVSPYLAQVSRWTRQSVWRTLGQALDPHAAWPGEARVASHGWMQGTAGLPPGKRAHIAVLAQKLTVNIENLRGRRAEVINPLLAQPMVEHCLAIPTPDLTAGGRDRALARRAFVACIPEAVRERREKGDFSVYYGRAVADGLGFLRPYLLAGRLAAKGLIDRARFERLLSEEDLIWRAETAPIMNALTVEAWVRVWEARRGSGI